MRKTKSRKKDLKRRSEKKRAQRRTHIRYLDPPLPAPQTLEDLKKMEDQS